MRMFMKKYIIGIFIMVVVIGIFAYFTGYRNNYTKKEVVYSTIETTNSEPVEFMSLEKQLQAELNSGTYTYENPFVVVNPYGNSPLTALILYETKTVEKIQVTIKGEDENTTIKYQLPATKGHRVPIVGLYPGSQNEVILDVVNVEGKTMKSKQIMIQTESLPANMQGIVTVEKTSGTSAYQLTMVSGQGTDYPFAYDSNGKVRWYLSSETGGYGIFPLSNQRFLFQDPDVLVPTLEKPHTTKMYEMDYLGRIHKVYYVEKGFHHEVIEKEPSGNFLLLSNSIEGHVEDVVEEIDRETGKVVKSLDLRKIFGTTYVDMIDWAHLNSISYDKSSNCVVLSPRNIHSGIKVDWKTDELIWILGNPSFWAGTPFENKVLKPTNEIVWHYQQHSISQLEEDLDQNPNTIHVMMFDNHWDKTRKVSFFDEIPESFVTFYSIDEANFTVVQDKRFAGVKSKITSNSALDRSKNSVFFMGGYLDPEVNGKKAMVYEFDYNNGEIKNQYSFSNTFYRAYEMKLNPSDFTIQMVLTKYAVAGELMKPSVLTQGAIEVPVKVLTEGIQYKIKGKVLYLKSKDHEIKTVELIGSNNENSGEVSSKYPSNYFWDYSKTGEGDATYKNVSYWIAIPLWDLNQGEYSLVVNYKGIRYNTSKKITIQ